MGPWALPNGMGRQDLPATLTIYECVMATFNRRGFLQILGAAGAAPFLPALPGRAVAGARGVSTSKALWAGIYAKSGSVPQFLKVARGMGLSDAAIRGVGARSVGVRVSVAAAGHAGPSARDVVRGIERVLRREDEGHSEEAKLASDAETPNGSVSER